MIRIHLNGQHKALEDALTVDQLIRCLQIKNPNVAVAVNYDIVPRSQFPDHKIKDGDKIDIVEAKAGG